MYQIRKRKKIDGGGIASKLYQKLANVYRRNFCSGKARELYDGEMHPLCANFCGPGTKISNPSVRNYPPYNAVDAICKKHDIAYSDAKGSAEKIRQADIDMLSELEKYKNVEPYYTLAKLAISGKMKFEDLLPGLAKRVSPEHYGKKAAGLSDYFKPIFKSGLEKIFNRKFAGNIFPKNAKKEGARKNIQATSGEIKDGIKLIMESDSEMRPYGSWTYKSQLYPGDVDLMELIEKCCNKEEATNKFVQSIKNIIGKIASTKGYYVGDIKSGVDKVYQIDIGNITYDNKGYHIAGFNPEEVIKDIGSLYRKGYLTGEERDELNDLCIDIEGEHNVQENYETLYDMLREKYILRWSINEIFQGYKVLPGKRKITLNETINQPVMTKIDMWTLISGRYIEFSNMLTFVLVDKFGGKTVLNANPTPEEIINGLKVDITKLMFSKLGYKPFKAMKRMWSVARIEGHDKVINDLTPIMQSDLGRISQIVSEIDTIILMFESINKLPIKEILSEIDGWAYRLENVYEIDVSDLISYPGAIINSINKNETLGITIQYLNDFKDILKNELDKNTIKIMKKLKYYPVKKEFIPRS